MTQDQSYRSAVESLNKAEQSKVLASDAQKRTSFAQVQADLERQLQQARNDLLSKTQKQQQTLARGGHGEYGVGAASNAVKSLESEMAGLQYQPNFFYNPQLSTGGLRTSDQLASEFTDFFGQPVKPAMPVVKTVRLMDVYNTPEKLKNAPKGIRNALATDPYRPQWYEIAVGDVSKRFDTWGNPQRDALKKLESTYKQYEEQLPFEQRQIKERDDFVAEQNRLREIEKAKAQESMLMTQQKQQEADRARQMMASNQRDAALITTGSTLGNYGKSTSNYKDLPSVANWWSTLASQKIAGRLLGGRKNKE